MSTDIRGSTAKRLYRPSLEELYDHVVPLATPKWYKLGLVLLENSIHLGFIRSDMRDHKQHDEMCCKEMFKKWLDTQPRASWDQLIEALREVELSDAAELLHRRLSVQLIPKSSREIAEADNEVFTSVYSTLSTTMTDIDNLLKYFVTENIINSNSRRVIIANPKTSEKARLLLEHISGPLEAGNSKPFRRMLDIMEKHGNMATKELANSIKIRLVKSKGKEDTSHDDIKRAMKERGMMVNKAMMDFMLEACRKGETMKVRFGRVLFSGASAAGKTNFYNLLLKKEFQSQHISTGLHESERVSAVKLSTQHSDHGVSFDKLDLEKEKSYLWSCLSVFTEQCVGERGSSSCEEFEEIGKHVTEKLCAVELDIVEKNPSSDESLPKHPPLDKDNILNILTFLDTGGQPEFINMLPAVNSCAMVTFIVHNMTESLDSPVTVAHGKKDGEPSFKPYHINCTNMQLIRSLISYTDNILCGRRVDAIFKKQENYKSYISFIGTHLDKVTREDVNKLDKDLGKIVSDFELSHVWIGVHNDCDYLTPVNATTASNSDEDHCANVIRKRLYDTLCEQCPYDVPIVWLILELEIRHICETQNYRAMSYDGVVRLCREKGLLDKEDDIKNGLRFHHLFGTLLYFEEVEEMNDIIFTDFHWLFNKLTDIVKLSYDVPDAKALEAFKHKGIFGLTLVKKLDFTIEEFGTVDSSRDLAKSFLKLLEHLMIITAIKPPSVTTENYFMPCLLKNCSFDLSVAQSSFLETYGSQETSRNTKVTPLLIQLVQHSGSSHKTNAFPRGVFCCLVVKLLQDDSKWELVWSITREEVFDNLVTLSCKDTDHKVTLIDKVLFLEVQIRHEDTTKPSIHFQVKQNIEKVLKKVCKRLDFCDLEISFGFLCTKCQGGETHMAKLSANHQSYTCRFGKSIAATDSHMIWFEEVSLQQAQYGYQSSNPSSGHPVDFCAKRKFNSLQPFTEDIISSVDVDTILPPLMSRGLVTRKQVEYFSNALDVQSEKQQKLGLIIVQLSEEFVEKFLQCLENTSSYEPHNSLLKKIRDGNIVHHSEKAYMQSGGSSHGTTQLEVSDERKKDQHLTDSRKRSHSSQTPQKRRSHHQSISIESSHKHRRQRSLSE